MLSLLPRPHTPQSSRGGKQTPELGGLRQSQEKVSPEPWASEEGPRHCSPPRGSTPSLNFVHPALQQHPHTHSACPAPTTSLGKFQQRCRPRASKPSPLPLPSLFSLPETCSVISRKRCWSQRPRKSGRKHSRLSPVPSSSPLPPSTLSVKPNRTDTHRTDGGSALSPG